MDFFSILTGPVAIATVALLGYIVGRGRKKQANRDAEAARLELERAKLIARELESIAEEVRKGLAAHHSSIARFKDRVYLLNADDKEESWDQLCHEAEEMLTPTLRLASQISAAYDEIRQQSIELLAFTSQGCDPLTHLANRKALDETLATMFAMLHRYDQHFSLAIVEIDQFRQINDDRGSAFGDSVLKDVARLIQEIARDTDVVARYGGEEFVIVMPHTQLEGASMFGERLRSAIEERLGVTVSGGVAQALDGDHPQSLMSRADAALYGAKAAGGNGVYRHTGRDIECILEEQPAEAGLATA